MEEVTSYRLLMKMINKSSRVDTVAIVKNCETLMGSTISHNIMTIDNFKAKTKISNLIKVNSNHSCNRTY